MRSISQGSWITAGVLPKPDPGFFKTQGYQGSEISWNQLNPRQTEVYMGKLRQDFEIAPQRGPYQETSAQQKRMDRKPNRIIGPGLKTVKKFPSTGKKTSSPRKIRYSGQKSRAVGFLSVIVIEIVIIPDSLKASSDLKFQNIRVFRAAGIFSPSIRRGHVAFLYLR
jgi:hypothetical protein